ncbi:MAG TPA: penicillin-binding protein 2 [Acidobacteriota bacterium]|nr:penicillin-binding protein 2 [Acidobacteriota bacterium]
MALGQDRSNLIQRLGRFRLGVMLVFLGFALQLWRLTVIDSDYYREQAEQNRIKTVRLLAPRGSIVDRRGRVLAESVPSFNLYLYRHEAQDLRKTAEFLERQLGFEAGAMSRRLEETKDYPRFQPVLLRQGLSLAEASRLFAHAAEYPELKILDEPRRFYRYGTLAAHVLGYVGEISLNELADERYRNHRRGDWVGKAGVERTYDRWLTGIDGVSRQLVDSRGRVLGELERTSPRPGKILKLTLDLELQQVAEEALGDRVGAVLAIDAQTGDVLGLVSHPAYDPNWFAERLSPERWGALTSDPFQPFHNRAVQSALSPGSVFKVMIALAALEAGVITPDWSTYCNGGIELYGHYFRCWRPGGHGRVALQEAIRNSCNVYFYLLGQRLGIDRIAAFAELLGLGSKSGIDLPGEVTGVVPSPRWKQLELRQPWFLGETISVAIGQGALTVTPVQLARAIAAVATGRLTSLRVASQQKEESRALGIAPEHLDEIREAMWQVVNQGGTGGSARVAGFDVCGKTGTAQLVRRETWEKLSEEDQARFAPNAWFVGFAPRNEPRIVVTVIVQQGGSGGGQAAPIAGEVLREAYSLYGFGESGPGTLQLVKGEFTGDGG